MFTSFTNDFVLWSAIKIGCSASKITPELGVSMAGYFTERKATAIHDDLYAKAIIFDDGNVFGGLMCCDLICSLRSPTCLPSAQAGDFVLRYT